MTEGEDTLLLPPSTEEASMARNGDDYTQIMNEGIEYVTEQVGVTLLENAIGDESEGDTVEMRWLKDMRQRHQDLHFYERPSLLILCTLLVLLCVTESLCFTPMLALILNKICEGLMGSQDKAIDYTSGECDPKRVQIIMSGITSLSLIANGLIGTFMSAKWGELSDRIGRVRVFAYMSFIKIIGNAIQIYSLSSAVKYHKWGIIFGASIAPFSGGILALLANGNSYIADISNPEHRAISMSIMMSAIYASFGGGPMLSGFLIKAFNGNNAAPMYFSLLTGALSAILCLTIVKEPRHEEALRLSHSNFMERKDSLSSSRSHVKPDASLFTITKETLKFSFLQTMDILSPVKKLWLNPTASGSLIPRYTVVLLLIIDVLFLCMTSASMSTIVLYATYKFDWRAVKLGYFISIAGLGKAAVLMLLSPILLCLLKKVYKSLDNSIDKIDIICIRLSMIILTLSTLVVLVYTDHESSLFVLAALQSLSAFCSPTLQSTIIKYCSKKFTGQCFGGMALIRSIVMLSIPPIFLSVYAATVSYKPELFLYIILVCGILGICLTFFLRIVQDDDLLRRPSDVHLNAPQWNAALRRASTTQSLRDAS